jgi:hypothetical protein
MNCNLIDVRKNDFINQETDEVVEGYISTFIAPSADNKYPPNLIQFYTAKNDRRGFGREFDEILKGCERVTDVTGLGLYELGYKFNKDKKLQKIAYLRKV